MTDDHLEAPDEIVVQLEELVSDEDEELEPQVEPAARGRTRDRLGWYGRLPRSARVGLWVLLVGWAGLGLLFVGDLGSRDTETTGPDAGSVGQSDLVLLAVRPAPDTRPAIALVHGTGMDVEVVLVPAGTIVEIPGRGPAPLADALDHGAETMTVATANVLGIKVPQPVVAGPDQLRRLVNAVDGVQVDVPETIEVTEDGVLRTPFSEGPTRMDADDLIRFMSITVPEEQELERVARFDAVWRGLFRKIASDDDPGEIAEALEGWDGPVPGERLTGVLRAAGATDLSFFTLPVTRSQVPEVALYDIDREDLGPIHEALAAVRTTTDTPHRVRLLVGAEGSMATPIAGRLVDAGFVIVLTGRAPEPQDTTRIVMAENTDELRGVAREVRDLMGMGKLGVYSESQTVFDVTLFVGRDWAEANGFEQPEPTPTSRNR